jgi:hypothetical protein
MNEKFKIKSTDNFNERFWEYNYPVQIDIDEEDGEVRYIGYMPRKNTCFDGEIIPKDEVKDFCDNTITKLQIAIELFKAFRDGLIDHIYYWDADKIPKRDNCDDCWYRYDFGDHCHYEKYSPKDNYCGFFKKESKEEAQDD